MFPLSQRSETFDTMPSYKRARASSSLSTRTSRSGSTSTRSYRARRNRFPLYKPVFVGRNAFPKMLKNTLKYCENWPIVTNSSGVGTVQWFVNGLYDPQAALGGHQPLYFDQLMGIYDHYHVLASRIKVTMNYTDALTSAVYSIQTVLYVDDDVTIATSGTSAAERPGAKTAMQVWTGAGGFFQCKPLRTSWSAKAAFGPGTLANDQLQGNVSANPTENQFFVFVVDGGTPFAAHNCSAIAEIEYDTVWNEIKTVAQS